MFKATQNHPVLRELLYPSITQSQDDTGTTYFRFFWNRPLYCLIVLFRSFQWEKEATHTCHPTEELILTAPTHSPDPTQSASLVTKMNSKTFRKLVLKWKQEDNIAGSLGKKLNHDFTQPRCQWFKKNSSRELRVAWPSKGGDKAYLLSVCEFSQSTQHTQCQPHTNHCPVN